MTSSNGRRAATSSPAARRQSRVERHQSRRDREHRDREGPVGRDAVRHRCGERRHRHHDQARSRGRARDTMSPPSRGSSRIATRIPRRTRCGGTTPAGSTRNCLNPLLSRSRRALCLSDSLTSFNLWSTPRHDAARHRASARKGGAQISGGQQTLRFFTSGEYEHEFGIYKIPDFDVQRFDTLEHSDSQRVGAARASWRAERSARTSTRTISPKFDASFSTRLHHVAQPALPTIDNNAYGIGSNGVRRSRATSSDTVVALEQPRLRAARLSRLRRPANLPGCHIAVHQSLHRHRRTLNYRPTAWLSSAPGVRRRLHRPRGSAALRARHLRRRRHETTGRVSGRPRVAAHDHGERPVDGDVPAEGVAQLEDDRRRAVGRRARSIATGAGSVNLTPGGVTNNAGATQFSDNSTSDSKTLGVFVEEAVGHQRSPVPHRRDCAPTRTARSARTSRASCTRSSASSHILSDEPWFPKIPVRQPDPLAPRVRRVGRAAGSDRRHSVSSSATTRNVAADRSAGRRPRVTRQPGAPARARERIRGRVRRALLRQPHEPRSHVLQQDHEGRAGRRASFLPISAPATRRSARTSAR